MVGLMCRIPRWLSLNSLPGSSHQGEGKVAGKSSGIGQGKDRRAYPSTKEWIQPLSQNALRGLAFIGVALYAWLFKQLYVEWLEPWFAYLGYTYFEPSLITWLLSWGCVLIPTLWMPVEVRRPSVVIYWLLYLVVYVPSIFVPTFIALRPTAEINLQQVVLFFSLWITGLGCRIRRVTFLSINIPKRWFWTGFAVMGFLLALWVAVAFNGKLKLVSVNDIYGQRAEAKDVLEGGYVGYAMLLLSGLVNPVLLALGVYLKKKHLFILGVLGQILIYSVAANKSVLASIVFIPFVAFLLSRWKNSFGLAITSAIVFILGVLYLFGENNKETQGVVFALTSIIILRTIAVPGLVMGQYSAFFATHPTTHLSHIHGIDRVIKYPYATDLGHELGLYYSGNPDVNANAHFWATDGIAAFGIFGLLFASICCAFFFWVLDSSSSRINVKLSAMIVTFTALNLSNTSLFTTLVSGGGLILIILFNFMPPVEAVNAQK